MESEWKRSLDQIRKKTDFVPRIAVVLGSGLGGFADTIKTQCVIGYEELPGFPVSTVAGHKGRFVLGWVQEVPVVLMQGRVHYYEGYSIQDTVLPIRLMHKMGAEKLLLTNAAGGICPEFSAGDFMLITDQISTFVPSPLRGSNEEALGPRFPDMSQIYDPQMNQVIRESAHQLGMKLREGVYLQTSGPQYETPAEIRMMRTLGASAVGMSTAAEAIAARHMGMRIAGISCITNLAAGVAGHPLSHAEVEEIGRRRGADFGKLLRDSIVGINQI